MGADAAPATPPSADERRAAVRRMVPVIYATSTAHMFALQLTQQSNTQIWLRHHKGDFAAQAKTMSQQMALASAMGIAINPVLAALCDVVGRKPVMASGLFTSLLNRLFCAVRPVPSSLRLASLTAPFGMGHMLGVQTALGDCFAGDSAGFGGATSKLMLGTVGSAIFCPILGAWLVQRFGVAAPHAVAALIEGGALVAESKLFSETLDPGSRVPQLQLKNANPLSFLTLLTNGPRLALLSLMFVLNFSADKQILFQVQEVHRSQLLKYEMKQRAMFMSISAMVAVPGYASAGALLRRFGSTQCLWLGLGLYMTEQLLLRSATTLRRFYMVLPLGMMRAAASSAIAALLQEEIRRIGLKQGEFQGAQQNLRTLTMVAAPLMWARVYGYGARRGQPGYYLNFIILFCIAQLGLERVISGMKRRAADAEEARRKSVSASSSSASSPSDVDLPRAVTGTVQSG